MERVLKNMKQNARKQETNATGKLMKLMLNMIMMKWKWIQNRIRMQGWTFNKN